ncbi:ATP-binding cassette domain-containing protein, partial [Escherichia coli]|uniref:ATP-binding cassette domain-containing protein n=1 Tax=Escherichia coli TaxID=562 RepID=UPI0013D20645
LTVRDLNVRYGDVLALEALSFAVGPGQIIGLVGGNGAGKPTTLSAISGLVKGRTGTIELDGQDITRLAAHQIVEHGLIHVPEGRRLFPFMT